MNKIISADATNLMKADSKIGVLSTVDAEGYPHLSFITSIQALGENQVTFGQFCTGLSKDNLLERPNAGFLAVSGDMRWLRGLATYNHVEKTGEVFDEYNRKPLFRYNSYCGFNHVHFLDLVSISEIQKLPTAGIVFGALRTRVAASTCKKNEKKILTHIGNDLFAQLDGLKFISWINNDGYPEISPVIQASPAGTDRIVFVRSPFGETLNTIPDGASCAVLGLNLKMNSVLAKGIYSRSGSKSIVDIERVYNSMPPTTGYIYPREEVPSTVTVF